MGEYLYLMSTLSALMAVTILIICFTQLIIPFEPCDRTLVGLISCLEEFYSISGICGEVWTQKGAKTHLTKISVTNFCRILQISHCAVESRIFGENKLNLSTLG